MLDDEELEQRLEPTKHVLDSLGMITIEHFYKFKVNAQNGLIKFGGSFAKKLGELLQVSDNKNAVKIMRVWQNECTQHEMLYRMYKAKEDAECEEK
jgi:hypothetical protein